MSQILDFNQVRALLPQQYPFIFIDKVAAFEANKNIVCVKNVTGNEWYVPGHFPRQTIFPGVLITEGMAQSGILLHKLSEGQKEDENQVFLLSSIKVRFLNPALPGDQLKIETEYIKKLSQAGIVSSVVSIGDQKVAKAELTFSITG